MSDAGRIVISLASTLSPDLKNHKNLVAEFFFLIDLEHGWTVFYNTNFLLKY
jgi:hypothetical protein